ncbi:S1C family serine protease [Pantanalinema sp. GBBB05]|uniref:S1C family serine protease n=1 Tax=Pantanalinema sp. GBBB05 TaxID=2604139 RepID=UPI001D22F352|nr:trypsin-like serine protease [Pantanalinema sp. GBBB05]
MPKIRLGKWQFWLLSIGLILLLGATLKVFTMGQPSTRSSELATTKLAPEPQALAAGTDRQPLTTDEIYQRVNPAVVTIYTAQGVGAGSIVRSDGLVLTNRHVVQNAPEVKIKTANGESFVGKVIDLDLRYDLALLQLRGPSRHLPTVTFASTSQLKLGDLVFAIGSPAGKSGVFTTGTFTRLTQHGSLQTSAGLLSEGNSGGPLLNRHGEVIGINKGVLTDRSGLATSIEAAKALIQRHDVIYKRQNSTIQS